MKLLILGGGNNQVNAIKGAKHKGYTVIVSDYYDDAPGKKYADYEELVSTFDVEGNIEVGKKYNIDGVMTLGTDQPVYTVSKLSETLGLPGFLGTEVAKGVTNKRFMKRTFKENNIPTPKFKLVSKGFLDEELEDFRFPLVIKPLDSQGQRGIYKLNSISEIRNKIDQTLSYSREKEVIIEEYYKSEEITISGWVHDDSTHILTVTDRVTFENGQHIGICKAHNFPSKHLEKYYEEIEKLTKKIVKIFNISNGPIYFQMLIGEEGIKVNEIACRIGGANEDELIPLLTGIDILDMVIDYSLGKDIDYKKLKDYEISKNTKKATVQLFFARPGKVKKMSNMEDIIKLDGVISGGFNFKAGKHLEEITNATARAGYMIIVGENETELKENLKNAYENLKVIDEEGNNLIIENLDY